MEMHHLNNCGTIRAGRKTHQPLSSETAHLHAVRSLHESLCHIVALEGTAGQHHSVHAAEPFWRKPQVPSSSALAWHHLHIAQHSSTVSHRDMHGTECDQKTRGWIVPRFQELVMSAALTSAMGAPLSWRKDLITATRSSLLDAICLPCKLAAAWVTERKMLRSARVDDRRCMSPATRRRRQDLHVAPRRLCNYSWPTTLRAQCS